MTEPTDIREAVRARYAAATSSAAGEHEPSPRDRGRTPAPVSTTDQQGQVVFVADSMTPTPPEGAPDAAVAASLGCGVPTAVADLHPGETVLDLGSGAGADVLIAARRVAPNGRAIGLGMTEEMVQPALAATVPAGSSSPFNTGISR